MKTIRIGRLRGINRGRGIKKGPGRCPLLGLVLLFWIAIPALAQTGDTADSIETTREALREWVETQRLISKEKRDLALAREMLNERIELVRHEIESLRGKIKDAESSIEEADKKRSELVAENDRLRDSSVALEQTLVALETRTRQLLERLPDPIRERVQPLSQRLPQEGRENSATVGNRFANVVGILNEIGKFNRDITVTSEVRELPGGTSSEVTTMYLGLGQAYYTDTQGRVAGVGSSTESGWKWTPANDAGPQIQRAIAIMKNEEVAAFVPLPIEIQ